MANNFFRVKNGLNLPTLAADPTVTPPTNSQPGDIAMYNGDLYIRGASTWMKAALQDAAEIITALVKLVNTSPANASNIVQQQFFAANTFGGLEQIAAITATNPNASSNNGGALLFSTSANGTATTPAERMRLDASGNVGIGTGSPGYGLHVRVGNAIVVEPTDPTNGATFRAINAAGTAYIGLDSSSGGLGDAYGLHMYHSGAYPIVFTTSGLPRMRISSSGVSTFYGYARIESPAQSASAAGNETIDCGAKHIAKKTGGDAEITLLNLAEGQTFTLVVTSTGSFYTLTWSPTIKWPGGVVPSPTITAASRDIYTFTKIGGEVFGTVAKDLR